MGERGRAARRASTTSPSRASGCSPRTASRTAATHDVAHLRAVLDRVNALEHFCRDADVVRVAAWFHDGVYDPDRSDNEIASAALAETVLERLDVDPDVVADVSRLVRLTATHDAGSDDRDGQVLCDADLAVLGGTQEEYVTYAAAIRLEYVHVTDSLRGRPHRGPAGPADRPRIYRTPTARERWEESARRNLTQEIAFLATDPRGTPDQRSGSGPPGARSGPGGRPAGRLRPAALRRRTSSLAPHRLRAERDRLLAQLRGHVVVVALERPSRDPQLLRERVQLVVGLVADEVRPLAVAPRPHRGVDQDRHLGILPRRLRPACGRPAARAA